MVIEQTKVLCSYCNKPINRSKHMPLCETCIFGQMKLGCVCLECAKNILEKIKVDFELYDIILPSNFYYSKLMMNCECIPENVKNNYKEMSILIKLSGEYEDVVLW